MPCLTHPRSRSGKTRRWMSSEQHINRLPGLLVMMTIWQQISLTNWPIYQSTTHTSTNKMRQCQILADHNGLKSGPPFMRGLGIRNNVPVSDNKLLPGLRVGLFALLWPKSDHKYIYWRWASCLRSNAWMHWSSNQGLSLLCNLCTWMTLVGTNVQPPGTDLKKYSIQNLSRIVAMPNVMPGQNLHFTTKLCSNYLGVLENLSYKSICLEQLVPSNNCQQRWVIQVTYGCYNCNPH